MSTYLHFVPAIAHAYWRAIQGRRPGDARRGSSAIYDHTWFEFSETIQGGFDAMYHGAQEVFGIAGRWRRSPYHSLNDEEMERLRAYFAGLPKIEEVAPAHAAGPSTARDAHGGIGRPAAQQRITGGRGREPR